jgi:hypothetical protein
MGWRGSRGPRVHCVIDWEAESTVRLWVAMKDDEKVSFPTARSPPADMSPAELQESRYGSLLSASGLRATRKIALMASLIVVARRRIAGRRRRRHHQRGRRSAVVARVQRHADPQRLGLYRSDAPRNLI